MNIVLAISVFFSCITDSLYPPDSTSSRVYRQYVSDKKLSEFEFVKLYKENFYTLSFEEDTIPYIIGTDSLFGFNLSEAEFCMYYNPDLLRNTGLVLLGDDRKKEITFIYTGIIDSVDIYLAENYNIIRIKEYIGSFGAPRVIKTKYIVSSPDNDTIKVLTLLSKTSTWLDSSRIALVDKFSFPEIYVQGIIDNQPVDFIMKITDDVMPTIFNHGNVWNGLIILEKQSMVPKKYHYDNKVRESSSTSTKKSG